MSGGQQEAFAKTRDDRRKRNDEDSAEIIDLVHLPAGTRPTPIAYLDYAEVERCREMDCRYYGSCLSFSARVRWRSFHCRQCPHYKLMRGEAVDEHDPTDGTASIIKLR